MSDDETKALAKVPPYMQSAAERWGDAQARVLRDTLAAELTAPEFGLFVEVCRSTGLDPFRREIHAVVRGKGNNRKLTFQTGIDGFRSKAEQTQLYTGQRGPWWCDESGEWRDVWLSKKPPRAAKVEVLRDDFAEPIAAIALYDEYVQTRYDGSVNAMWTKMPTVMLAKCAEALALRKAFPRQLAGLYSDDEMGQADNGRPPHRVLVHEPSANGRRTEQRQQRREPVREHTEDVVNERTTYTVSREGTYNINGTLVHLNEGETVTMNEPEGDDPQNVTTIGPDGRDIIDAEVLDEQSLDAKVPEEDEQPAEPTQEELNALINSAQRGPTGEPKATDDQMRDIKECLNAVGLAEDDTRGRNKYVRDILGRRPTKGEPLTMGEADRLIAELDSIADAMDKEIEKAGMRE